jgi:type IV secretory pathway TraG/TraD family ATPase VirD4
MLRRTTKRRRRAPADDLDRALLTFDKRGRDTITLRSFLSGGCLVLGASSAGKTTSVCMAIVRGALNLGGAVVLTTVKPSDTEYFGAVCRRFAGVNPRILGIDDRFNPLAYAQRTGDPRRMAESLTDLACIPIRRSQQQGGADPFWQTQAASFIRALVTIAIVARQPLSYRWLHDSLLALQGAIDPNDTAWQSSCPAFLALRAASRRGLTAEEQEDLDQAARFLLQAIPAMPEKTRASVVATAVGPLGPLVAGAIGRAINGTEDSWRPDEVLTAPGALILDMPTQVYGAEGATVQRLLLTSIQRAILTRDLQRANHPIFLVVDEAHTLLDETDAAFLSTARDRRSAMVLATQSVSNIRVAMSSARDSRSAADAILALPGVRIIAASHDPETQAAACAWFAQRRQPRISFGSNEQQNAPAGGLQNGAQHGRPGGRSMNVSREWQPDVQPSEIAQLARGGPPNRFLVEAFIYDNGKVWRNGRLSYRAVFRQTLV